MAAEYTIRIQSPKDLGPESLICSRCQVSAQIIKTREDKSADRLTCPECDRSEDVEVAIRRATEYIPQGLIDQEQQRLRRKFARSQAIDFIPDKPARPPAFIFRVVQ